MRGGEQKRHIVQLVECSRPSSGPLGHLPPGEGIRCGGELADSVVRPYMMLRIRKMPSDRQHPDSVRRVVGPREVTRVYLKTPNVTGSEEFSRCARHFFAGILTYFKEK